MAQQQQQQSQEEVFVPYHLGDSDRNHQFSNGNKFTEPSMGQIDIESMFYDLLPEEWFSLDGLKELQQCRERTYKELVKYLQKLQTLQNNSFMMQYANAADSMLVNQIQAKETFLKQLQTYLKKWEAFCTDLRALRNKIRSTADLVKQGRSVPIPDFMWSSSFTRDCELWWNCSVPRYESIMTGWFVSIVSFNIAIDKHIDYSNKYLALRHKLAEINKSIAETQHHGTTNGLIYFNPHTKRTEIANIDPSAPDGTNRRALAKQCKQQIEDFQKNARKAVINCVRANEERIKHIAESLKTAISVMYYVCYDNLRKWTTLDQEKQLNRDDPVEGTCVPEGIEANNLQRYWPYELCDRSILAFIKMCLAQHTIISLHNAMEQTNLGNAPPLPHDRLSRYLAFAYWMFHGALDLLQKGYEGPVEERQTKEWEDTCKLYRALCFSMICYHQAKCILENPDMQQTYLRVPNTSPVNFAAVAVFLLETAVAELDNKRREMPACVDLRLSFLMLPRFDHYREEIMKECASAQKLCDEHYRQPRIVPNQGITAWYFFPQYFEAPMSPLKNTIFKHNIKVSNGKKKDVNDEDEDAESGNIKNRNNNGILKADDIFSFSGSSAHQQKPVSNAKAPAQQQQDYDDEGDKDGPSCVQEQHYLNYRQLQKMMHSRENRKRMGDLSVCFPEWNVIKDMNQTLFLNMEEGSNNTLFKTTWSDFLKQRQQQQQQQQNLK